MTNPEMVVCKVKVAGGNKPSEDKIFDTPGAVIVLDGESHVYDATPSGGWFAYDLGEMAAKALTATPDADLRQVLAEAIGELAVSHGVKMGHSAASVAMVRHHDRAVDALVLGGCTVVAMATDGTVVEAVRDDRPARVKATCPEYEEYRARLRTGPGGFDADHRDLLAGLSDRRMRHLNREGGYWMAQAVPEAARHALVRSWSAASLSEVLIMTDGVSAAVEEYGLMSWAGMARVCRTHGPALVLDRIRDAELDDHQGRRWPREALHDDKALVSVTIPAAG